MHCLPRANIAVVLLLTSVAASGCKTECEDRSVDDCGECRVVYAQKIVDGCAVKATPVACMDHMDCDTALAIARDASGTEWLFADLCIPSGWSGLQTHPIYPPCE